MTADQLSDQDLYALVRQAYPVPEVDPERARRTLARVLALASQQPVGSAFTQPHDQQRGHDRLGDRDLDALVRRVYPPVPTVDAEQPHDRRALRTLARVLALASQQPVGSVFPQPHRHRGRVAALASGGAVLAGAIATTVVLLGTSAPALAQKFPVFASSSTTPNQGAVHLLQQYNGASTSTATPISTRYGTGYITTAKASSELCLAIPASAVQLRAAVPRGREGASSRVLNLRYVGGCYSVASAEGKGLILTLLMQRRDVEVVVVLPKGASRPLARDGDGSVTPLQVEDGVATAVVQTPSTLEYTVAGRAFSATLAANSTIKLRTPAEP